VGGGQARYVHERTDAVESTPIVRAFLGLGGLEASLLFPTRDFGRPSFSLGLDLLGLL
jgi:hypothetical protein